MIANLPLGVPRLVVPGGPPGSRKSTWAKQNACAAVHVSQDLIDAISPDGFEHAHRPIYAADEDAVARAALEHGHTVIVDRTKRTRPHRYRRLEIAREADCPGIAVAMRASFSERNRCCQDKRRLTEERMERMIAAFEPVRPDEGSAAIYDDSASLSEILVYLRREIIHEYCDQAR